MSWVAEQNRWNRGPDFRRVALITAALRQSQLGGVMQAARSISARHVDTNWAEIASLYTLLERLTGNPMVTLKPTLPGRDFTGRVLALLRSW